MTRLVLHAGDCKSGSTAIQSVLQLGSWRYTGDAPPRLHYAQGGRRDGLNHHRLSDSLHLKSAQDYRELAWGRLGEEFAAAKSDVMVVSSERFEFAPPEAVLQAITQFLPAARPDLQVIIYVRPHAERILSGYAQNVRQGLFTGEMDAFLDQFEAEGRFHYAERLMAWKAAFGDALTVRPMIRDQLTDGCVVRDFLTFCAGTSAAIPIVEKIPHENKSLNTDGLELLRALHTALHMRNPARDPSRAAILQRLTAQLEQTPSFGEGRRGLPMALRPRIRDSYAPDAARCDAEIFGAPVMVPALERTLADDRPLPPGPSPEEIARLRDLSLVWFDMMGQMRQQMAQVAAKGRGRPGQPGPARPGPAG